MCCTPSVPGMSGKAGLPMRPCISDMSAGLTGLNLTLRSTSEPRILGVFTS